MNDFLTQLLYGPIQKFIERLVDFIPNLFAALLVLIIGIVSFWLARFLISRMLRLFRFDKFTDRLGVNKVLARGGIRSPLSTIIGRFFAWTILLLFIILSLGSLNVPAVEGLIEKFLLYIPNIFVALIIIFSGIMLGNFLGRATLIASVNAGVRLSGLVGRAVKLIIMLISISIAMEHLGIGKETVHITFAIIFGAVALACAIALGLGGKDLAREYLEKILKGDDKKDDISHL